MILRLGKEVKWHSTPRLRKADAYSVLQGDMRAGARQTRGFYPGDGFFWAFAICFRQLRPAGSRGPGFVADAFEGL